MAEEDAILATLSDDAPEPTTEVETPEVETEVKTEEEVEAPASEETESEEETETETQEEAPAESETETQPDQKELARQAYEARQAEKARRDEVIKAQQEQYLAEAEDQQELALRQLQIDAYTNKVENNITRLQNSYDTAIKDIDIFRNPTPEIAEYLADAIDEFQARHVQLDELGNPINVSGDLHQFLSNKASLVQKLTQVGARNERTAKAKQSAAVTPTPTGSPKKPKVDPILSILQED